MATKKSTNSSIIIFHSPRSNTEESLKNQQVFLEQHEKRFADAKIINYIDSRQSDLNEVKRVTQSATDKGASKLIMIVNSPITVSEWDKQYDMYVHFVLIGALGRAELYFMDSEGRLFKKVDDIDC